MLKPRARGLREQFPLILATTVLWPQLLKRAFECRAFLNHLQAHKQKHLRKGGVFVCMVRLERFERPTAWFVARRSLRLLYKIAV